MILTAIFEDYFAALKRTRAEEKTEHTDRGALEALLRSFAMAQNKNNQVIHEAGREGDKGAPDYKVRQSGQIVGYVENKKIDDDLNKVARSEQIARYSKLSKNILLTDYLQFVWIRDGKIEKRAGLAYSTDLLGKAPPSQQHQAEVSALLEAFFSTPPLGISRAQNLAVELAQRCRLLRDDLVAALVQQRNKGSGGRLMGLYQVFRDQVFTDLNLEEFADAFAQTLGYGLFLAKYNVPANEVIDLNNARQYVPQSFALIRELVDFLRELEQPEYVEIKWVVEEIVSLVNGLDLAALHADLSFANRKLRRGTSAHNEDEARLFERDPYIYFYEDFLKAYDASTRESRGVYYTPPPVVSFIIRAVDDILKLKFSISDGLADHHEVTVLDFACGTGTFMVEVFEQILSRVGPSKAELMVREHLLKNIFGFEFLIAPYTIAHLKLSQYLKDKGYPIPSGERLQVFLTNTLEPIAPQTNMLLPMLTAETRAAQKVKDQPILVITGNPPYSGHSRNPSSRTVQETIGSKMVRGKSVPLKQPKTVTREVDTAIGALIKTYMQVDGRPLGERNPKWLHDDYVKFIRFAQMKMDAVERGVVGIITNHSFLDNPTFRGMRRSLMLSFDQIYILDLHGSAKRKEVSPDGATDENVFDIQQGVAISLFIKGTDEQGIFHEDLWGTRIAKYQATASANFQSLSWNKIEPIAPFYLFVPQSQVAWAEYEKGHSLTAIFPTNVLGFQTHRDAFAVAFEKADIEKRLSDLLDTSVADDRLRSEYRLKDNRDWQLASSRAELMAAANARTKIIRSAYRPFDDRWCYFGHEIMDYPRRELIDHVAGKDNLELVVSRQISSAAWQHVFIANLVANDCLVSNRTKEANQVFPLYKFPTTRSAKKRNNDLFSPADEPPKSERVENFAPDFRAFIDKKYSCHLSPEEVLGYIYAILHAPTYRTLYAEFLRMDFPRIPFCELLADFRALSALGTDLMEKHLLRSVPKLGLGAWYSKGIGVVGKVVYDEASHKVAINPNQSFENVPLEVFKFEIGGYQVLDKYLKDRKGRALTLDEINNAERIVNVLAFTVAQLAAIDSAYGTAFKIETAAEPI